MQETKHSRAWEWLMEHTRGRSGMWWLGAISFLEPIFLPLFPETGVIAMTFARREYWRRFVLIAVCAAVLGAAVAFYIGHLLFHYFGPEIISRYGLRQGFRTAHQLIGKNALLIVLFVALVPVPDKVFIIPAGFFHVPFLPFIFGFLLRRSFWFILSGYLAQRFGEDALVILRRWFAWVAVIVVIAFLYGALHFFHVFSL